MPEIVSEPGGSYRNPVTAVSEEAAIPTLRPRTVEASE